MKRNYYIIVSIIFCLCFFIKELHAFDWTRHDIFVEKAQTEKNETYLLLKDGNGNKFSILYNKNLPDKLAEKIIVLNKKMISWDYIKIKKIHFTTGKNIINCHVLPKNYGFNGINFVTHLPAGMMFTDYGNHLKYNFRIFANNIFVKLKGRFENEKSLSDLIFKVIHNPFKYTTTRDPEALYKKLVDLQNKYDKLNDEHEKFQYAILAFRNSQGSSSVEPINKKIINRIKEIKKNHPKISNRSLKNKLREEGLKISDKELRLILSVYYNEFN